VADAIVSVLEKYEKITMRGKAFNLILAAFKNYF
jgi:hypothetical protein